MFCTKQLSDGTYLVWKEGTNEHLNHVHIAPDGTILSWKVEGEHVFNRGEMRKAIRDLLNIDLKPGWG